MKSKLGVALLWIAVFLLGAIAGGAGHHLYREHLEKAYSPQPLFTHEDIIKWMADYLEMDAQQTESLRVIFDKSRGRYIDLAEEFRPRYDAIRIESENEIKNILRPDQKKRYEEFLEKVQSSLQNFSPENSGQ